MAESIFGQPPARNSPDGWIYAGPASSFLDLEPTGRTPLSQVADQSETVIDNATSIPCKILQTKTSPPVEIPVSNVLEARDYKDQVLIFRYRGKFHAIDHSCPHMSHPLSQGKLYDIEDFGIRLSVGVECSKHRWSFDLFTGESTRGAYKLKIWEVQLRDPIVPLSQDAGTEMIDDTTGKEVWVRRQRRMG